MNEQLSIKFMAEKKKGLGEDSSPLFLIKEKSCAIGVFDGMGGSGAALCNSVYGEGHTKAYVASRIIKNVVFDCLNESLENKDFSVCILKDAIQKRYIKEQEEFPAINKSLLRSKLVREYPTTMALVTVSQTEDSYEINSYWAGDSRNFLWTSDGFYQISSDDLVVDSDPMENLRNDAALSNCLCADRPFRINQRTYNQKSPFIVLSATDGCFGYFPTPMHFENVLMEGLKSASSCHEWETNVMNEIVKVTGDDISLSLIAVGVDSFQSLKEIFIQREPLGLTGIAKTIEDISETEALLASYKKDLEEAIQKGWLEYKKEYLKMLKTNEEEKDVNSSDSEENDKLKMI